MTDHPLEDEEVVCGLTLIHVPTGIAGVASVTAPADGPPDINEAVEQAKQAALDNLLSQLEQRGA